MRTAQGSFFSTGQGKRCNVSERGGAGQEKNVQGVVKQHVNWSFIRQEITKKNYFQLIQLCVREPFKNVLADFAR